MNKTFTLSSVGQNPENFSCSLSKTEFIPPNHQIALLNLNMDTHTGTSHHYQTPEIGFKLHNVVIGGGARLHKQLNPPELMANGDYADMVQVNRLNENVIFFYFKSNNGVATLTNSGIRYNASSKMPEANWSWQNNFVIPPSRNVEWLNSTWVKNTINYEFTTYTGTGDRDYTVTATYSGGSSVGYVKVLDYKIIGWYSNETDLNPSVTGTLDLNSNPFVINWTSGSIWISTNNLVVEEGIPTQTTGLLGPYGVDNTPTIGNDNQIVNHTPLGNINTWTNHNIQTLNHNNTGYIEKIFVPNNQLPRAEFFVSLDNLPIENHISNNTFQGIVPSVYTHHNRFDSEADESIVPHHLIYQKLNNKGHLRIGKIDVSIRDNITNDILHTTTFSNPTNLTLHIKPI